MKVITPLCLAFVCAIALRGEPAPTLSGTRALEWPEADLSERLMDGAHAFVERKIREAGEQRGRFWSRDFSSSDAYVKSIAANRERLREILGVVDPRLPPQMEGYGDIAAPALVAETPRYRVWQARWPVLEGVWGCGLLVVPNARAVARAVVVPDAEQTPEQLLGLAPGIARESQIAARLAEAGFELVLPVTISRAKLKTTDPQLRASDQTYREWIYRQAFQMGRHVIGYEVQTVLAAVDWFRTRDPAGRIGVAGYDEGALVAFASAALDSRIDAALVSGYFAPRENAWQEPIYRNVWSRVRELGDADVASLVLPRALVIEHSRVPDITGHKGEIHTPPQWQVEAEFARIPKLANTPPPTLVGPANGAAYRDDSVNGFAAALGVMARPPARGGDVVDQRGNFDPAPRHDRFFRELEQHVQLLIRRADVLRDQNFLLKIMPELAVSGWTTERRFPLNSAEKFIRGAAPFREKFWADAMGRFDEPLRPANPRTRKVAETDKWTAYDVVLDVYPELFAWGVLVVPKDLRPGEKRPVVVCQHGRNGVPRDTLDGNKTAYNNFAGVLAERGFVTFAPHNLYRGEDRYRWLSRKANTIGATLFSFIIAQHDQILRWLDTLPFVDGQRIAFYGLSYGGETAVRVPPILEKYALSICSGDFNQWTRKVASTEQPWSFMRTIEWEMPYWNLGQTFDYAEMAYLMVPRPFMVERGHHDRVGRDPWVAYEYAKVRWLYAQLGLADRTEMEFFQGGHSINGEGTFRFLEKHLNWPAK